MANEKQSDGQSGQAGAPQPTQGKASKINPFKDVAGEQTQEPKLEEETELEQQRKEAMTERD